MPLAPGTRLGPYEITAPLGAGGMGEVYRARDPRLGRDVAIKALPVAFAQDPERLARFEREAKLLASLSHPNIAGILGLEEVAGAHYLVLELVDGETLAERLARGALPLPEVLDLGRQVAAALEAAHERSVVHRDLKPGNIMFTASGEAKVLDFGLAKGGAGSEPNLSASPTMTHAATQAGVILGTAAYMSPEQARGKSVDRRADIWSFACVLYECLAGRRVFEGETVSDLVARILEREPEWSHLPPNTPPRLVELLKRCLRKDAHERQRDAGDVRLELEEIARGGSAASVPVAAPSPRRTAWWAAVAAAAILAAFAIGWFLRPAPRAFDSVEFTIEPPTGYTFGRPASPRLSPDGRTLVCMVNDPAGVTQLALRPLQRSEIRVLPGTANAVFPFWSPHGGSIGFFADGKLRTIGLDGSTPVAIADAKDGRGGSWSRDGMIAFVPTSSGAIFKVAASGGAVTRVTTLDAGRGDVAHRWPCWLRDGKHFLYVALTRSGKRWLCVGGSDGGPGRALRETETAAVQSIPGWILTVERRRVMAQRFDERALKLIGDPAAVAECGRTRSYANPNISADARGMVAYQAEVKWKSWLRWYDANGSPIGARMAELDTPTGWALAPDQGRVVVAMGETADLWMLDLEHPTPNRLTFHDDRVSAVEAMMWSHDSKRIAYSVMTGHESVHELTIETLRDTVLFDGPGLFAGAVGWPPGGPLAVIASDTTEGYDMWRLPEEPSHPASIYQTTPELEYGGPVSPDGRWLACAIFGDGKFQVRILSWPQPGTRFQVALEDDWLLYGISGSAWAGVLQWTSDGRALVLFDAKRRLIAIPVAFDAGFRQGTPRTLITLPPNTNLVGMSADLRRFLLLETEPLSNPAPLRVLTSWPERLKAR